MIREEAIQIPFRYAAGWAGSQFLVALRDQGRILGARCPSCEQVTCPATSFCRCGGDTLMLVEVGPGATVVSFTATARGVFGLVRADGADTAMLHRLLGDPSGIRIGQRVRARLADKRTGTIHDIVGFEPAQDEAS